MVRDRVVPVGRSLVASQHSDKYFHFHVHHAPELPLLSLPVVQEVCLCLVLRRGSLHLVSLHQRHLTIAGLRELSLRLYRNRRMV